MQRKSCMFAEAGLGSNGSACQMLQISKQPGSEAAHHTQCSGSASWGHPYHEAHQHHKNIIHSNKFKHGFLSPYLIAINTASRQRCQHEWVWSACRSRPSRAGQTGPKGLVGQHNRPGLHWDNSCPYWQVFLDVNGAIDGLGPYRRVVGAIHYINLNVHLARQWREPSVLSYGGQPVRFSLCTVVERANIRVSTVSVFVDSLCYLRRT